MRMLSTAAWFQIAGAFLIVIGVARKLPAPPDSAQAHVATVLMIAGTLALVYGIYKADLHPTWFKIGGAMLFATGFIGKSTNSPDSPQYEIAGILTVIGLVAFVEGLRKARAVHIAALKEMNEETESSPPDSPPSPSEP